VSEPKLQDKPFQVAKTAVWEAYVRVKANKGAAGVDEQSIAAFEADRDQNLYKIWNRMSSGCYFPPPVKAVEIPKAGGTGVRLLGVPTVADRIAQTVVKMYLEPKVEPISPLLANVFMHYAFDAWMVREFPSIRFERYCDDAVVHCRSERQARQVRDAIAARLAQVGLELHPDKTRIVYCKDADRPGSFEHEKFTFLGYEFRPRLAKNRQGKHFVSFLPAVSTDAKKAMATEIRSWGLGRRSDKSLDDLARMFNSIVQGWINYYGCFYKSELLYFLRRLNNHLVRWATRKYHKRLRNKERRAMAWLAEIARRSPRPFAHWRLGARPDGWAMGAG
jgi:hypothetical protein